MKNFNELMTIEKNRTECENKFIETHQAIIYSGTMFAESAINLAVNLKKMKDEKFYLEAGFETFADYTEKAIGLKVSQAYNYINVLENFDEEFLHSNVKIGISKLRLLSSLTTTEREEIQNTVDIEGISVSELKEQIKKLEQEKQQAEDEILTYQNDFKVAEDKLTELEEEIDNRIKQAQEEAANKLNEQITKLQQEIKTLKAAPVKETVKEVVKKDEKAIAELTEAKQQLDKTLQEKEQELLRLKKQLENAGDQAYIKFKIKFEELQTLCSELQTVLTSLDADKQEKCKQALKAVVGGLTI